MHNELEMAILNFMNEAQKFFPTGWGNLPIGKAYDDLWNAFNHSRGIPTFEEFINKQMPKNQDVFIDFTANL